MTSIVPGPSDLLTMRVHALRARRPWMKPLDRGAAGMMGAFGLSLLWTSN